MTALITAHIVAHRRQVNADALARYRRGVIAKALLWFLAYLVFFLLVFYLYGDME